VKLSEHEDDHSPPQIFLYHDKLVGQSVSVSNYCESQPVVVQFATHHTLLLCQ